MKCKDLTDEGKPCSFNAKLDSNFCGTHSRKRVKLNNEIVEHGVKMNGKPAAPRGLVVLRGIWHVEYLNLETKLVETMQLGAFNVTKLKKPEQYTVEVK